ncbi:hypothetical protein F5883DRAFT_674707 [Diaporthe sp. PMI_573]|nr:hypothetical protein F5883DRAFT_674707 [Diaporthaceae sp. PMI_573]
MSVPSALPMRTDDRVPDIIAVATVGITISTIAVTLRFWSRAVTGTLNFWWDDWLILTTTIFSHAFQALGLAWTSFGLGQHIENVAFSAVLPGNYMSHASITLYAICIWLIKLSALFLYARIFKQSRTLRRILWALGIAVTAWMVCTVIIPWFNCTPVSKTLDPFGPGYCFDRMPWYLASAFINAFIDLAILLTPMPTIWRLQMTRRKKISVTFVFLLGYCSAFLSFARFIMIIRDPLLMSVEMAADPYWRTIPLILISFLEAPVAIVALCAPAIGQLGTYIFQNRSYASLLSLFSTRKSTGKSDLESKEQTTQQSHSMYHTKSAEAYSMSAVAQNQQHQTWTPMHTGAGENTVFSHSRVSDDSQGSTAPAIPRGAIGVTRGVAVTHQVPQTVWHESYNPGFQQGDGHTQVYGYQQDPRY